ncbi:hypothetical protein D3C81_810660 [compost metagenome]
MVPERHHAFAREHGVQDLRDAHGQRRCATGARQDGVLADFSSGRGQLVRGDCKAPVGDHLRGVDHVRADDRGGAVHGEVDARLDDRGSHHGHDRHERFHQHAAVADVGDVAFIGQQLGRGARADQCMEAGHRATGNGDEQEREHAALPHRASAVGELGQCRHLQFRHHDQDADGQANDGADLEEGGQVVTRGQQQPHRQHRRDETVADQHPGDLHAGEGEHRAHHRVRGDLAAVPDGGNQQHQTDHGDLTDLARADIAHVHAHQDGDGHRRNDGEHAPRAAFQRLHHDHRQHRQDDDHDHEDTEQRDGAGHRAHFLAHQIAERTAVAARGDEQDHEVLHCTGQHHAGNQPKRAGQVAHLRSEHRADQRASARDGSEVVAEQDVLVGGHIVQTIVVDDRGCGTGGINPQHLVGDEQAVVAEGDQVQRNGCHHDP